MLAAVVVPAEVSMLAVQTTVFQGRPPDPLDSVGSMEKSSQPLIWAGTRRLTRGTTGLSAVSRVTDCWAAAT